MLNGQTILNGNLWTVHSVQMILFVITVMRLVILQEIAQYVASRNSHIQPEHLITHHSVCHKICKAIRAQTINLDRVELIVIMTTLVVMLSQFRTRRVILEIRVALTLHLRVFSSGWSEKEASCRPPDQKGLAQAS